MGDDDDLMGTRLDGSFGIVFSNISPSTEKCQCQSTHSLFFSLPQVSFCSHPLRLERNSPNSINI